MGREPGAAEDDVLVAEVLAGDLDAFDRLVERYQGRVYRLALRYSRDPQEAFDLAQEAFLRVYQGLGDFRGRSRFSTWMYRIATNVCLDEVRRRKQRAEPVLDEPVDLGEGTVERQLASSEPGPEQALEQAELAERVRAEIDRLPEAYRSVIVLRDLHDLSYEEIAEVLAISQGTVKSRLHRGRAALRARFEALELLPSTRVQSGREFPTAEGGEPQ